ncbi:hypothetical protein [Kitasatospora sp. DSM 101779]|uniref:hypothetical protein n=1 Tax=Kitasatospora sp. DSM 101779 TaxID=2853165 RepID=UPI0021D9445B|nr:hypothetical protein [Kitasatospora sp. DSM 101779]MCU7826680.1 hypothetical protein [Kitasatospora sp. DSM 101779]
MLVHVAVGGVLLLAGLSGLAWVQNMTPAGFQGWGSWNRRQRIISVISLVLALAGLLVLDR